MSTQRITSLLPEVTFGGARGFFLTHQSDNFKILLLHPYPSPCLTSLQEEAWKRRTQPRRVQSAALLAPGAAESPFLGFGCQNVGESVVQPRQSPGAA